MHKKQNLPKKTCPVCHRDFHWRKKWARNWDEVKYCSKRCSGAKTSLDYDSNRAK